MAAYTNILTETITLSETQLDDKYLLINDSITINDDNLNTAGYNNLLEDEISVIDDNLPSLIISLLIEESIDFNDNGLTSIDYLISLNENINANIYLNTYKENDNGDLEVESTFDCFVLNNTNKAISRYNNYNFNSFVLFNDKYYGSNETGLYELDYFDDTEMIPSKIKTGLISLGVNFNPKDIFIYQKSNGNLKIKISNDKGQNYEYKLVKSNNLLSSSKITTGRGLIGYYFQFELSNDEISDFEIDSVQIVPLKTGRKI